MSRAEAAAPTTVLALNAVQRAALADLAESLREAEYVVDDELRYRLQTGRTALLKALYGGGTWSS